jgi:hypothetical protein
MPSQITRQRHWIGRLGFVAVIAVVLGSCAWVFDWFTAPPDDQVDAEAHLDRPLLAYELWGDTPSSCGRFRRRTWSTSISCDWT